jgi:catechol 2,3-dioxygenase-like lactoylglutathione lyase family enzyme
MGGGIALRWSDELLGGLGVSGMTPQRDGQIAAAGAAALPLWPHLDAVSFSCADAEACAAFFCSQLGFRQLDAIDPGPGYASLIGLPGARLKLVRLALGGERLELLEVKALGPGQRPGRPFSADSRSNDLWFQHICIVVRDLERASAPLRMAIAGGSLQTISSAPQCLPSWNSAAAGIEAFKLHSPEGHCLELLQFPPDKGEARWHGVDDGTSAEPAGLFLGIDHSAIGVADTERSCRFYEQLLGLRLGGDGINTGPEQDELDGLSDTRVRITSHRCPSGAGIECLDYRKPEGGRPMPADLAPQDRAHSQLRLLVGREPVQLEAIAAELEVHGGRLISAGVETLSNQEARDLGFQAGLQVCDPDGHRLQLVVR